MSLGMLRKHSQYVWRTAVYGHSNFSKWLYPNLLQYGLWNQKIFFTVYQRILFYRPVLKLLTAWDICRSSVVCSACDVVWNMLGERERERERDRERGRGRGSMKFFWSNVVLKTTFETNLGDEYGNAPAGFHATEVWTALCKTAKMDFVLKAHTDFSVVKVGQSFYWIWSFVFYDSMNGC